MITAIDKVAYHLRRLGSLHFLALLVGCGSDDRNGVADIASSPRSSIFVRDAVAVSPTGEDLFFPVDAAFGPSGEIYVVDQMAPAVRVFDSAGVFVRSIGRKGEGPGELLRPSGIAVSEAGFIAVTDDSQMRITVWGPQGDAIWTVNRQTMGPHVARWADDSSLYVRSLKADSGSVFLTHEVIDTRTAYSSILYSERVSRSSLLQPEAAEGSIACVCPFALSSDGRIAVAPAPEKQYRVRIIAGRDEALNQVIAADVDAIPYTKEQRADIEATNERVPQRLRASLPERTHRAFISDLAFDRLQRLWVRRPALSGTDLDIYSQSGDLVERVHIPENIRLMDVRPGALLAIVVDDDVPTIVIFKRVEQSPQEPLN